MTTTVVYAGAEDGYIYSEDFENGLYSVARAGSGAKTADTIATEVYVGQDATPFVYEGFVQFDTSGIADGDTVSAAVLNVTSQADSSATDFTIQARLSDWGTGLTTADYVAGASLSSLTLLATYATSSGFTANTAYDFTDSAMPANVNKTGATRMLLCSSRTVGNNAPSGDEYVGIKSADTTGTTSDPKLTVTHAAGGGDNRTGTGSLSVTPSFSRTGAKAGSGTGSLTGGLSFTQAGAKAGKGTGTLALTATLSATGAMGSDNRTGTGSLALALSFAATGRKQGAGTGLASLAASLVASAAKAGKGTGTLSTTAVLAASGTVGGLVTGGRGPTGAGRVLRPSGAASAGRPKGSVTHV
jgi:hypothetical protein